MAKHKYLLSVCLRNQITEWDGVNEVRANVSCHVYRSQGFLGDGDIWVANGTDVDAVGDAHDQLSEQPVSDLAGGTIVK